MRPRLCCKNRSITSFVHSFITDHVILTSIAGCCQWHPSSPKPAPLVPTTPAASTSVLQLHAEPSIPAYDDARSLKPVSTTESILPSTCRCLLPEPVPSETFRSRRSQRTQTIAQSCWRWVRVLLLPHRSQQSIDTLAQVWSSQPDRLGPITSRSAFSVAS